MPQIKMRGIETALIRKLSKPLIDELALITQSSRYLLDSCISSENSRLRLRSAQLTGSSSAAIVKWGIFTLN